MDVGPKLILLVFALVVAVVAAFVDAVPQGAPRVRLLPIALALFIAAFLF